MAKFIISVDEAIVAVRQQFGLSESVDVQIEFGENSSAKSVDVQIEFGENSSAKSDDGWQDVPENWTLSSPPGELDYNDQVEVMLRNGEISSGRACYFGACWAQADHRLDIVKYRRV